MKKSAAADHEPTKELGKKAISESQEDEMLLDSRHPLLQCAQSSTVGSVSRAQSSTAASIRLTVRMRIKKEPSIPERPRRPASDEFDRNAKELVDCLQKGLAAQGVQAFVETHAATETQVARVGCQAPEAEPEWVRLQMDGRKAKVELKGGFKVQKLADHVTRKFACGVAGQSVRLTCRRGDTNQSVHAPSCGR